MIFRYVRVRLKVEVGVPGSPGFGLEPESEWETPTRGTYYP